MHRILLSLTLLGCITPSYAQSIYTWVDENGVTHFDEAPRNRNAVTVDMPKANIVAPAAPAAPPTPAQTEIPPQPEIIMYGAAWCGVCKKARHFFSKNGIRYTEYDVETSAKGKSDYQRMNGSGVPIFLVDGQRYNGFDPSRFKSILSR